MLHVRGQRSHLYILSRMTTNNAGWSRGWFYLRNFGNRLPAFTNKVLRERPEKWNWGVSPPPHQARLEVLTNAVQHLAWIAPRPEETEPNPPDSYVVSLVRLHEQGFGVPVGRFMRALCEYYGVELHNFSPNSISQDAVFVAVCEEYLGIEAHWDLWIHLFRGELFINNAQGQPKRYARAGGLMLHVTCTSPAR